MSQLNRCDSGGLICIHRGDDSPLIYDLTDSDDEPLVGSGRTYRLSVTSIEDPPDATTLIFQSDATVTTTVLTFPFIADDVVNLLDAYYDIQETDGVGKILTIDKGVFEVQQDNTK